MNGYVVKIGTSEGESHYLAGYSTRGSWKIKVARLTYYKHDAKVWTTLEAAERNALFCRKWWAKTETAVLK